jgi:predicted dehydrogenase
MEDPALAGGALLDLGIYPVSFLSFVLGSPSTVKAVGHLTDRGVDLSIAGVATGYASAPEAVATFTTSMGGRSPAVATIVGTEARLELGNSFAFYQPGPVRLVLRDGTVIEAPEAEPASKDALVFEACHLAHLVAEGATESPYLPLDETVSIMETMDEIRRQVGLVLPGE